MNKNAYNEEKKMKLLLNEKKIDSQKIISETQKINQQIKKLVDNEDE